MFALWLIIFVMGNKGGTGKSFVTRALAELMKEYRIMTEIIDADKGNPDVAKVFGIDIIFNLHRAGGFMDLVSHIETLDRASSVVVSTPAGLLERAAEDGRFFVDALQYFEKDLGRKARVLWVIDANRDVVESLKDFLQQSPVRVDVVKNLYFAESHGFQVFDNSKTKIEVEKRGGTIIEFPALAERIAAQLTNQRLTIAAALGRLPLGERYELLRWKAACVKALSAAGYLP